MKNAIILKCLKKRTNNEEAVIASQLTRLEIAKNIGTFML